MALRSPDEPSTNFEPETEIPVARPRHDTEKEREASPNIEGIPVAIYQGNDSDVWDLPEDPTIDPTNPLPRHLWHFSKDEIEFILFRALQVWHQEKVELEAKLPVLEGDHLATQDTRCKLLQALSSFKLVQWIRTEGLFFLQQEEKTSSKKEIPPPLEPDWNDLIAQMLVRFENRIVTFPRALFSPQEVQTLWQNLKMMIPLPDFEERRVIQIYSWEPLKLDESMLESRNLALFERHVAGKIYKVKYKDAQTGEIKTEIFILMSKAYFQLHDPDLRGSQRPGLKPPVLFQVSRLTLGEGLREIPMAFIEGRPFYRLSQAYDPLKLAKFRRMAYASKARELCPQAEVDRLHQITPSKAMELPLQEKGEEDLQDPLPFCFRELPSYPHLYEGPSLAKNHSAHRFIWLGHDFPSSLVEEKVAALKTLLPHLKPDKIRVEIFSEGIAVRFPPYVSLEDIKTFQVQLMKEFENEKPF